ncbi:MAG: mismatch repair protein MutS [Segetibacter sp.]|nr:mismatch repair protein MutS [Segetibacter sp.]
MQADKTTVNDLSIFHHDEEQSVFHHLNFTTTTGGKDWLRFLLAHPYTDLEKIRETQETLKLIIRNENKWPTIITNGTIMVVGKFYDSSIDEIPAQPNLINGLTYKITKGADYSLIKFSITHFINFTIGLRQIIEAFAGEKNPPVLQVMLDRIKMLTDKPAIKKMSHWDKNQKLSIIDNLTFGRYLHREFKEKALELVEMYSKLDAYYSMAMACRKSDFCFPEFKKTNSPYIETKNLFHLLVHTPVAYNVTLNQQGNFLFLTGANMAGKSTFIKAVGVAVYLAHVGMGVPAESFQLSLFDGLLSNIQVEDNISRGESYFFNEVQRIKKTIEKINDGRNWLILIDELFKGTNVQDAMKCSTTVIEGLRKMKNTLFILSTHLYEIGEGLRQYPNIKFNYFETRIEDGQLIFSYQLKEGISNDRLGYLILKREGVVNLLENL